MGASTSPMRTGNAVEDAVERMTLDAVQHLLSDLATLLHTQCGRPTEYSDLEEPETVAGAYRRAAASPASESPSTLSSSASETSTCPNSRDATLRLQKRRKRNGASRHVGAAKTVAPSPVARGSGGNTGEAGGDDDDDVCHYQI